MHLQCFRFPPLLLYIKYLAKYHSLFIFSEDAEITYTHNHTQTHINNTHSSTEPSIVVEILVICSITGLFLAAPATRAAGWTPTFVKHNIVLLSPTF